MTGGDTASQSIVATLLTIWSLAGVKLSRYGMNGELELEHCLFTKFEAARQVSAAAKQGSPAYVTHTAFSASSLSWWRFSEFPASRELSFSHPAESIPGLRPVQRA